MYMAKGREAFAKVDVCQRWVAGVVFKSKMTITSDRIPGVSNRTECSIGFGNRIEHLILCEFYYRTKSNAIESNPVRFCSDLEEC